jgi:hypothetical protein
MLRLRYHEPSDDSRPPQSCSLWETHPVLEFLLSHLQVGLVISREESFVSAKHRPPGIERRYVLRSQ